MKKITLITVFLIVFVIFLSPLNVFAYTLPAGTVVEAESAVLYCFNSDMIVYENNSREVREPASLTKLMTALIVAESDPTPETTMITADETSIMEISGTGASNANLKEGEVMSALDLLYCLLVSSGCDAANVLATHYSGSIGAFVERMNQRAKELGMADTHFVNAHGLSAQGQKTTAYDLLLLSKEVSKYQYILDICSESRYTVKATNLSDERYLATTNYLIDPSTDGYYRYATGLKTGYTDNAGRCLISIAEKDNERYLCILLGCPVYGENGQFIRREFSSSRRLYEWAFSELELTTVCNTETPYAEVKVKYSSGKDYVLATAAEDVTTIIPKDSAETVIVKPYLQTDTLQAPVTAGTVVGYAEVLCAGETVGKVDLVLSEDCGYSVIKHIFGVLGDIFTSTLFIVIVVVIVVAFIIFIVLNILHNRRRRRKYRSYRYNGRR